MSPKHESRIILNVADDDNEYLPTITLLCACDWSHTIKQEYDRYSGYGIPVTMEQLWAIWMNHLGGVR
jgi:hypothetical protein